MSFDAAFTLVVLVAAIVLLAREVFSPSATVLAATVLLLLAGVLTPGEALAGFANPAPATVAALYVLARAAQKTGALQPLVARALGDASGPRGALGRILLPTAGASAFLNNTPIVATLAPQVADWAERTGRSPSRYLMPLSFAAILGGTLTVIGTSTNLLVSGMLEAAGHPGIGMFEITKVGLPVAVLGVLFLVLAAPRLLPDRRPPRTRLLAEVREFTVHMSVVPGGPLDGTTVEGGGLRHLQGVFLVELERDGDVIAPVAPATVLRGGDRLTFVGRADLVVDLQRTRGLVSGEERQLVHFDSPHHTFFEAVIGPASPLAGTTLKAFRFRDRYQAAVVAIHRAGERVRAKLGEVQLEPGDTLLILSDPGWGERWRDRRDFLLAARLGGAPPAATRKAGVVAAIALAIVVGAGSGLLPILHLALAGAIALVALRVLTPAEARDAVDLDVVVLIAAAFGLGAAMEKTGLAGTLAGGLLNALGAFGAAAEKGIAAAGGGPGVALSALGPLLGLVLATILLTELITNNAAAALMVPIALATAQQTGLDPRGLAIAVTVAASASFLTPIGYQTNMMVYGPGGYRFGDYARLGAPLTLTVILAILLTVPLFWGG